MKRLSKLICVLMVAIMLVIPFAGVDAKAKKTTTTTTEATTEAVKGDAINVYVFYSDGCPHCAALHTALDKFKEDKSVSKMFNVVDYEVSTLVNSELMQKVGDYFKHQVDGVPFYVIGNQYFEGYGESGEAQLLKTIKDAYNSKDYVDVVSGIGSGEITGTIDDLNADKEGNNIVGIIILAVTVVIIIVLIVCSSKNTYYDEDDEEETEEVEEVKTSPAKKTSTAKKTTTKKAVTSKTAAKKTSTTKKASSKSTSTKKATTKNTKTTKKK